MSDNQRIENVGDSEKSHEKQEILCPCPPKYVSYFYKSPRATISKDILLFHYSFGYNCKKLFNLCLIDPDVLVFASGNLIHFFRISTKDMTFRRSAGGGGIGFITVNPNPQYNFLTVAENGTNPLVLIYKFPQLDVISVLEGGAEKSFTCASYSPDGELLATQAGEPDYMLTIWKWKTQSILLRTQSFQNDVLNVIFSPYNPKQIITCGLGHIKFWKMSKTFTGLKLLGELGRFGKTEISDIYAIYPMPDEKVISGCEWGNLLVWDDGLIKVEVCRKNRKPCHTAPITMISMEEGEVMTVGMDGYVRMWFWETVEIADPPEDDRFIEIEPIYEFKIGTIEKPCDLRCFLKIDPQNKKDGKYYVQDGNGRIWYCDINIEKAYCRSNEILVCHNGRILAADTSPFSNHIATICEGGYLNVYDYISKRLLFQHKFISHGTDLIWLPTNIDPHGTVLFLGFKDGVIRQILIELKQNKANEHVFLLDVIKPHSQAITKLSLNPKGDVLVSGSQDCTVFIFCLRKTQTYVKLLPVGFINALSVPNAFNWNAKDPLMLLIGCVGGEMHEIKVPKEPCDYTKVSYHLHRIKLKTYKFTSCKSEIRRQIKLREIERRKNEKRKRKIQKMLKLKEENPGVDINEETFLYDSEPEEELEPLYYPKTPNPILWLRYTSSDSVWLSLGGYDAGYIYERYFSDSQDQNQTNQGRNIIVFEADDIEIHSYLILQNYLVFGMQDGSIRVNLIKEDFHELSDFWKLSMHDNLNGIISKLCTSYDENYIFSVGYDGNIFSYKWNGPKSLKLKKNIQIIPITYPIESIQDIDDMKFPSLEQQKVEDEKNRHLKLATENKEKILDIIADYKLIYKDMIKRNRALPFSQRFTPEELELDPRITADLIQLLQEKLDLVRRKLEFDLEKAKLAKDKVMDYFIKPMECYPFQVLAIQSNKTVKTFRIKRLDNDFYWVKAYTDECIAQERLKKKISGTSGDEVSEKTKITLQHDDSLLLDISSDIGGVALDDRMKRILKRYGERRLQQIEYNRKLKEHYDKKPDINVNDKNDVKRIRVAEETIGDYKLKVDSDYKNESNQTVSQKFKQILEVREELFNLRNDYNQRIKNLRSQKSQIYDYIKNQRKELEKIHRMIPVEKRKFIPELSEIQMNLEYPEDNLKLNVYQSTGISIRSLLYRRSDIQRQSIDALDSLNTSNLRRITMTQQLNQEIVGLEPSDDVKLPSYKEICEEIDSHIKFSENDIKLFENQISTLQQKYRHHHHQNETPWEIDMRYDFIINNLIKQDEIINEIDYQIKKFDKCLDEVQDDRLRIELDAKFLEQFLVTLNQEFWILRDCEKTENELLEKVENIILKRNNIQSMKSKTKIQMDDERKVIEKLKEQIKNLHEQFMKLIKNNKYADYLQKIFKKKYKPPKVEKDDTESTSSSSSTDTSDLSDDERDDIDDENSLLLNPIRLDENICPPGLDTRIYDETFAFRNEKHTLEQKIHIGQRKMEEKKKEIDDLNAQKSHAENKLDESRKALDNFLHEKQALLNQIQTLVVLRLDQIAHFHNFDDENIYNLNKSLLFNTENISKLQNRVAQLESETLDVQSQYKSSIVHLAHLKSEVQSMNREIAELEQQIKSTIIKKFGKDIDIDELERMTLKKYIFDKKTDLEEEKKEFEKIMAKKKAELAEYEQELIKERQKGTEKLNILAILQEEKNFLTEILIHQRKLIEKSKTKRHIDFNQDIMKLKDIEKQQKAQIEFLEKEIRTLRIKSNPFLCEQKDKHEFMNEILPPQLQYDYENQHIYSSLQEKMQASSKVSSAFDSFTTEKMIQIIQKFLQNTIGTNISSEDLTKLSKQISNYLCNMISNLDYPNQMIDDDEIMENIIENIQKIIPQKYSNSIKSSDILNVLNDICVMFKDDLKGECKIEEIICGIISTAIDTVKQTISRNFSQDVVKEIFCQMIEVLSKDDLNDAKILELISENLVVDSDFDYRNIDVDALVEAVMHYATINQIEELTTVFLKDLGNSLMEKFVETSNKSDQLT